MVSFLLGQSVMSAHSVLSFLFSYPDQLSMHVGKRRLYETLPYLHYGEQLFAFNADQDSTTTKKNALKTQLCNIRAVTKLCFLGDNNQ